MTPPVSMCNMAVEKTLKAFLAFHGQLLPRTHDLEELAALCQQIDPTNECSPERLAAVSVYAVDMRYDLETWPTQQEATAAIETARFVRDQILRRLPPDALP